MVAFSTARKWICCLVPPSVWSKHFPCAFDGVLWFSSNSPNNADKFPQPSAQILFHFLKQMRKGYTDIC